MLYRRRVQIADFDRHLRLEGCFNFRDLGGYATGDGRTIRPRTLFRADGPHALTAADTAVLGALGLVTLIDLRTGAEAGQRGTYASALRDVTAHHLPLIDVLPETDDLPRWIDPAVVARRYRTMLDDATPAIATLLALLSDARAYPAVFHCSAGKDRTGIVAALVLGLLGVPDDTIVGDYALSRDAMHRLIAHLHEQYPDATDRLDQVAPAMVAAEPEAMAQFIASVRVDFGSFAGYAAAVGVPGAARDLQAALLT